MLASPAAPEPHPSNVLGIISATRLAAEFDISLRTLSNWQAAKLLPKPLMIRGRRFFKISDIQAMLSC